MFVLQFVTEHPYLTGAGLFCLWVFFNSVRFIPNNRVGILEVLWSSRRLSSAITSSPGTLIASWRLWKSTSVS